jgi:hypothetical protein
LGFGGDVGDESVTRGAAYPFTDATRKRAVSTVSTLLASGKSGLLTAARPYPSKISGLRRWKRSESVPEKILTMAAVASAMPSMIPIATGEAPRIVTRKSGRRLWIISEERSMSSETNPNATTLRGSEAMAIVTSFG